jgi:NADPH:quinone reductase-like Zn-dependent oxidoreductase
MKAVFYNSYGGTELLQVGILPEPVPAPDQLLIQVKAVSLNPADNKILSGNLKMLTGSKFPQIPCSDFAGIVKETGSNIKGFAACDKVYGFVQTISGKPGALAEFVLAIPGQVRKLPEGMAFEEAATLPGASLTALNGLRKGGNLSGKSVLVNGATGGVGHFAVQIAHAEGAKVTAICSTHNIELARKFGADQVIDYTKTDLSVWKTRYDMILDAYGHMKPADVRRMLNRHGVYTSTLFFGPLTSFITLYNRLIYGKTVTSGNMRSETGDFEKIEALFKQGKLNPYVEKTFQIDQAREAFRYFENGRPRGKIVVRV